MSDANEFRQFAKEAMQGSSEATNKDDKRALEGLACAWAQAVIMSDRVLGSSWTPHDEKCAK